MSVALVVETRFTYRYILTGRLTFYVRVRPGGMPLNVGRVSDANSYDGTIPGWARDPASISHAADQGNRAIPL